MLNTTDIVTLAESRVGIQDPEVELRPNLEHFVAALNSDNALSALGETSVRKVLIDRTADRLEGIKWLRDYPAIGDEVIGQPVFLTGLPRSAYALKSIRFGVHSTA